LYILACLCWCDCLMFEVKKATSEDAEPLTMVARASFGLMEKEKKCFNSIGLCGNYSSIVFHSVTIKEQIYLKAVLDHKIIGGCILIKKSEFRYSIDGIFIDPGFQNKGYGEALITSTIKNFPEVNHTNKDRLIYTTLISVNSINKSKYYFSCFFIISIMIQGEVLSINTFPPHAITEICFSYYYKPNLI